MPGCDSRRRPPAFSSFIDLGKNTMEERRYISGHTVVESVGGRPRIIGYAAVFNMLSWPLPLSAGKSYREIVRPGAFAESLRSAVDVLARFEHSEILGRTGNN